MFFLRLPDDILLLLADNLEREDINALAQTSRRLHQPLNQYLYQYNIRHSHSSALRWGVELGREGTVKRCLELGAPVDCKRDTPLVIIASERGHDRVLKLLLDHGANPNEDRDFPRVPLSLAIQNGHDAAVRVLLAREGTNVTLPSAPFSQQPLHYALERGSLECFQLLLERGADLQQYEVRGARALHPAVRSGSQNLVEFLIGRVCDPLVCCGYTALSLAAVMGHLSLVQYFLAHGVDPNIRDRVGFTALGHAAKEGHADVVETLLAWGVETGIPGEDSETALSWAVRENHEKVVDLLLKNGADPNSSNRRGECPLYRAVTNGSTTMFKALLAYGARPDTETDCGGTLLHLAIRQAHQPLIEMLIQLGIEVNKPDWAGWTALSIAAASGNIKLMELLLANGADMTTHDIEDRTPVDLALRMCHDEAAELLLRRGANPSYPTTNSSEQLFHAVKYDMVRVTRFLLENGVEPDAVDRFGSTPLLLVATDGFSLGRPEIAEMLLRTGRVNIHARDPGGRTPLICATAGMDTRLMKLLLSHGANVEDRDQEGFTAFLAACYTGDVEICKILLDAGADINCRDNRGNTPLFHAADLDDCIYEFLVQMGAKL
jgi:ankyrin repeat protein